MRSGRFEGALPSARHFGGAESARHFGGRGALWGAPYGYYGGTGYYDSTLAPDEGPTYPTNAAPAQPTYLTTPYPIATTPPIVKPPTRSSCSTQTYKVRSDGGGEASVNVVHC
jgi:hypothetical protein